MEFRKLWTPTHTSANQKLKRLGNMINISKSSSFRFSWFFPTELLICHYTMHGLLETCTDRTSLQNKSRAAAELWDGILGNKAAFQIHYPVKWVTKLWDSDMSIFFLVSFMCSLLLLINGIYLSLLYWFQTKPRKRKALTVSLSPCPIHAHLWLDHMIFLIDRWAMEILSSEMIPDLQRWTCMSVVFHPHPWPTDILQFI